MADAIIDRLQKRNMAVSPRVAVPPSVRWQSGLRKIRIFRSAWSRPEARGAIFSHACRRIMALSSAIRSWAGDIVCSSGVAPWSADILPARKNAWWNFHRQRHESKCAACQPIMTSGATKGLTAGAMRMCFPISNWPRANASGAMPIMLRMDHLRLCRRLTMGIIDRAFIQAAVAAGHQELEHFNGAGRTGVARTDRTVSLGVRQSSAIGYLKKRPETSRF